METVYQSNEKDMGPSATGSSANDEKTSIESTYSVKEENGKRTTEEVLSTKNEDKAGGKKPEVKVDKPKKSSRRRWGCYLVIFFFLLILFAGIALGVWAYPKAQTWLQRHNFIQSEQGDTSSQQQTGQTNVLLSEESTVISVVKNSSSSVVSIAVSSPIMTSGKVVDQTNTIGSGFIVDASGIIVTNQHVVSDLNSDYVVVTADSKEHKVVTITRDDLSDIAVIKIDATDLKPLTLGNSDNLQIGQSVVAIGTPLGEYAGSVTTGVISGLHRTVTATQGSFWGMSKDYEDVIQTDAAINPGNSGGPLLNSNGEVVGVNFATTSGAANISFALPINVVKTKLEEYRKFGKFIKPFLGVSYEMISPAEAAYYKLAAGALVDKVGAGSPAEKAGVQVKDIIETINGVAVESSLQATLQQFKVGEEVTLKIARDGKEIELKVTLGEGQ